MKGTPVSKRPLVEQLHSPDVSLLKRYKIKAFGNASFWRFLQYELTSFLFGNTSGALGYALRSWFYPKLFRTAGKGIIFGKGVVLRHPPRISLGDDVSIDDYTLLDASGSGGEGIIINQNVIISRNCVIQAKTGPVTIHKNTDIGSNTIISSMSGITIGHSVLVSGNCYIGGGLYISDRLDIPMMDQGLYSKGPVVIEDDVWLGAGVVVLDGVQIGRGSIVGAGAVVAKDLPDYAIAVGIPADVIKFRRENTTFTE